MGRGITNSQSRGYEFRCVNIGYGALDGYHPVPNESFPRRNLRGEETDSETLCLSHVLNTQVHRYTRPLYIFVSGKRNPGDVAMSTGGLYIVTRLGGENGLDSPVNHRFGALVSMP